MHGAYKAPCIRNLLTKVSAIKWNGKMHQVNARHQIIREWRSLPKELRQTEEQTAAFAMQIKDKYKFSSESADPYQMSWSRLSEQNLRVDKWSVCRG